MERQESGNYRAKVRPETFMFTNTEFREDVSEEEYRKANRMARKKKKEKEKKESGGEES